MKPVRRLKEVKEGVEKLAQADNLDLTAEINLSESSNSSYLTLTLEDLNSDNSKEWKEAKCLIRISDHVNTSAQWRYESQYAAFTMNLVDMKTRGLRIKDIYEELKEALK